MNDYRLSKAPKYLKLTLTCFLLVLGLGYLMGLLNIYDKTHLSYAGAIKHILGSEEEMIYGKEFGDLVSVSHTHILGWAMMFLSVLIIFAFSNYSGKLKGSLAVLSFVFIVLDQGAMWLTRYVAAPFAWLFMLAGFVLAALFCLLVLFNLYDLWMRKAP